MFVNGVSIFKGRQTKTNKIMKVPKIIKSRTVITIVVLFLIGGIGGIRDFIPESILPIITAILSALAVYFRVKPKVKFE